MGLKTPVPYSTSSPERYEARLHYPTPNQAQRLASVLRATPSHKPLSVMRKWPEVTAATVGSPTPIDKARDMAEQKALAAHQAAIEKSVERLAARRTVLRTDLDVVEAELKLLLSMLKASGYEGDAKPELVPDSKPKAKSAPAAATSKGKANGKGKAGKAGKAEQPRNPAELAISLLEDGEVTPELLAEQTGQSLKNASQMLARLFRNGLCKRPRRGVYAS
jgi:hypothetical protein